MTTRTASLSSGLLARKGEARPAMRPQVGDAVGDDLGWNDMGEGARASEPALPPVLVERADLAGRVETRTARTVSAATAARIRRETDAARRKGGKAAFTLRLDADRHLALRLAGAVADRSAQALMTEALDAFLDTMPEVAALVAALPAATRR